MEILLPCQSLILPSYLIHADCSYINPLMCLFQFLLIVPHLSLNFCEEKIMSQEMDGDKSSYCINGFLEFQESDETYCPR